MCMLFKEERRNPDVLFKTCSKSLSLKKENGLEGDWQTWQIQLYYKLCWKNLSFKWSRDMISRNIYSYENIFFVIPTHLEFVQSDADWLGI